MPPKPSLIDASVFTARSKIRRHFTALRQENQQLFSEIKSILQHPDGLEDSKQEEWQEIRQVFHRAIQTLDVSLMQHAKRRYQSQVSVKDYEDVVAELANLEMTPELKKKPKMQLQYFAYSPQVLQQLVQVVLPALESYLQFAIEEFNLQQNNFTQNEENARFLAKYHAWLQRQWQAYVELQRILLAAMWQRFEHMQHQHDITDGDPLQGLIKQILVSHPELAKTNAVNRVAKSATRYLMFPEELHFFHTTLLANPQYRKKLKTCFWLQPKEGFSVATLDKKPYLLPTSWKNYLPKSSQWQGWFDWLNPYPVRFAKFLHEAQGSLITLHALPNTLQTSMHKLPVGDNFDARLRYLEQCYESLMRLQQKATISLHPQGLWDWFFADKRLHQLQMTVNAFIQPHIKQLYNLQLECLNAWLSDLHERYKTAYLLKLTPQKPLFNSLEENGINDLFATIKKNHPVDATLSQLNCQWQKLQQHNQALQAWQVLHQKADEALKNLMTGQLPTEEMIVLLRRFFTELTPEEHKQVKKQYPKLAEIIAQRFLSCLAEVTIEQEDAAWKTIQQTLMHYDELLQLWLEEEKRQVLHEKALPYLVQQYCIKAAFHCNGASLFWFEQITNLLQKFTWKKTSIIQTHQAKITDLMQLKNTTNTKSWQNKARCIYFTWSFQQFSQTKEADLQQFDKEVEEKLKVIGLGKEGVRLFYEHVHAMELKVRLMTIDLNKTYFPLPIFENLSFEFTEKLTELAQWALKFEHENFSTQIKSLMALSAYVHFSLRDLYAVNHTQLVTEVNATLGSTNTQSLMKNKNIFFQLAKPTILLTKNQGDIHACHPQ